MMFEERYRLTHELWLLYQLRYRVGAPQVDQAAIRRREVHLMYRLGYLPKKLYAPYDQSDIDFAAEFGV